jgi:polyisoprenoid-binding protein YceI
VKRLRMTRLAALALLLAFAAPLDLLSTTSAARAEGAAPTNGTSPAVGPAAKGRIGFVGNNIFGRADGEFRVWRVVEHAIDLASPSVSRVVVEVDVASLDTQNESRDEHLRTVDFFDVEKFPVATVRGHSPRPLAPATSGRSRYAVTFDVSLHGVQKTVEGEVEVVETSPVVVEGGFQLRRTDFGIGSAPSRWNPASIDDDVPVRFRIAFE